MHSTIRRRFMALPILAASLLWAAAPARAEGYRNPPMGPALGRSGNATVWGDDASSLYFNPALLADLQNDDVLLSLSIARTRIDWSGPGGMAASSRDPWQILPNLFASRDLSDSPWTLGVGLTTPYGQSVEWPLDTPLRYSIPYFAEIGMMNATPVAARRFSPTLAAGFGLDLYYSTIEFKQRMPLDVALGIPGLPEGEMRAEGDGTAVGGRLGVTWNPLDGHQFAVSYRSRFRMDYDGDFSVRGIPPPLDPGPSDFSTRLKYPDIFTAGYGILLSDTWRAEMQVEWLGWSVNRDQPLRVEAPYDALVGGAPIQNRWKDTWTFGVGTDWTFSPGWTLRAGYTYMESPIPDETLSPLLPDADRQVFAIGLGHTFGSHSLDLAYTYNRLEKRTTPIGRFEYQADLIGVSYAFRF
ncbi:MAG: outer membrane protein transport protein [Kiritimatiellia bacterium]|nr:outer membrane protein transport protein [Kiritimatiellia bacterium]